MADTANPGTGSGHSGDGETRRDFLYLTAGFMGVVGTAFVAWPIIDSMNPAAAVRALAYKGIHIIDHLWNPHTLNDENAYSEQLKKTKQSGHQFPRNRLTKNLRCLRHWY